MWRAGLNVALTWGTRLSCCCALPPNPNPHRTPACLGCLRALSAPRSLTVFHEFLLDATPQGAFRPVKAVIHGGITNGRNKLTGGTNARTVLTSMLFDCYPLMQRRSTFP